MLTSRRNTSNLYLQQRSFFSFIEALSRSGAADGFGRSGSKGFFVIQRAGRQSCISLYLRKTPSLTQPHQICKFQSRTNTASSSRKKKKKTRTNVFLAYHKAQPRIGSTVTVRIYETKTGVLVEICQNLANHRVERVVF